VYIITVNVMCRGSSFLLFLLFLCCTITVLLQVFLCHCTTIHIHNNRGVSSLKVLGVVGLCTNLKLHGKIEVLIFETNRLQIIANT